MTKQHTPVHVPIHTELEQCEYELESIKKDMFAVAVLVGTILLVWFM